MTIANLTSILGVVLIAAASLLLAVALIIQVITNYYDHPLSRSLRRGAAKRIRAARKHIKNKHERKDQRHNQ